MKLKLFSKGVTLAATLFAITGTCAVAQTLSRVGGDNRAKAIGEMTDARVMEVLRADGRVAMSGQFFETDSTDLSSDAAVILFKLAKAMESLPEMRVAIVGHTDSVGDFTYNVGLSQRRAEAVRNALIAEPNNVAAERLVAMGAGSINPVASNFSEEGRGLNRRVEFVLLDEELIEQETTSTTATSSMTQSTAKYAAKVPENVWTPDVVETETLGTLEFFDGMPNKETVAKAFDNLDLLRSTTAFLDGMKIASLRGLLMGYASVGMKPNEVGIQSGLMDARSIWLTPNTTTIYVASHVDTSGGPIVIDAPAGMLGILDDAAFDYVTDIGALGPDKSEGGKYLILPPDYDGEIPEGYFTFKSKSFDHWLILRSSPDADGKTEGPVAKIKETLNIYSLADADNPPAETFHELTGLQYNTVHANDFHFFEEVNDAIQANPSGAFSPEILGNFATLGIKKGHPFEPDARLKRIMNEAAAIGNATARALTFSPRDPGVFFYEDRQWNSPFQRQSHEFLEDGARVLDDQTYFFYYATGITPAMTSPPVGAGSIYEATAKDSNGDYLDGGKTYSVTLPGPIPAKNFWSFMVYSGQTRSVLETDQKSGGVDSNSPDIAANDDGSYTVWFAPEAPAGKEGNWVQTMPGKSFNVILRLYGPLEPWFDKTWVPGDLILQE
jgi:outer membrane protein OmpA-like peptidoglycan-associated protein